MDLVIDAQIFGWFYQSSVLDKETPASHAPDAVFDRLGGVDMALLDEGRIVEEEWRRQADQDWFEVWLAARLTAGDISLVGADGCRDIIRKLWNDCGFPKGSRDKWYVCIACTHAEAMNTTTVIVTEDIDFYEPAVKKVKDKRKKHLREGSGKVAKLLRKHSVDPRTIARHIEA